MATKTLSITEEAYKRLAILKKENESFSQVINRVVAKHSLREIYGIVSEEAGKGLDESIKKERNKRIKHSNKKTKYLLREFG